MKNNNNCNGNFLHEEKANRVLSSIPGDEFLYQLADFFRILGDSTRVKIIKALAISEMCVYDLSKLLNVSQSAMSHQLRVLRQANIVKYRKEGKVVFYSLKDEHIERIIRTGIEHLKERTS